MKTTPTRARHHAKCLSKLSTGKARVLTVLLAATLANVARAQIAATLTDIGVAPTPDAEDISQLTHPGFAQNPDGLNYYFDNGNPPGQTFTTGNSPNGYVLDSVSLGTAGNGGNLPVGGQAYTLRLYSVAGSTATLLATYQSQGAFTFFETDWLQWTGLGFGLQPNTQYAYSFRRNSAGWENMANITGDLYTGGEVVLIPQAGGAMNLGSSHSFDASFNIGLSVASTLTANPLNFAPASAVTPGTAVTISTAAAVGPGPITYQWQTDGGTGGALTNIPGATSLSLAVSTTGKPPGSYKYALVVSNGSTSLTNAAVLAVYQNYSATLTDVGASIIPGPFDISQLTSGADPQADGLNYYSDNNPGPGQTFTTGSNAQGYDLTSLTLGTGGGSSGHTEELRGYEMRIFSVSGNTATLMAVYTNASFLFTYGDWLKWSGFTPLHLAPNSTYAYAFRRTIGDGWAGMAITPPTSDVYSGGQICLVPPTGGPLTYGNSGLSDAAFDLGLIPVGIAPTTPFAASITVAPASVIAVGAQLTLNEAATGATPLTYQWRTDGAGGGTLTNIPSSNTSNLVLNTSGWAAGLYKFDVVVANVYGASTSAVVSITVQYANTSAVLTDIGATIPPLAAEDISQTSVAPFANNPDGMNYYFDNGTPPGQTFTTGGNAGGYTLSTLAISMAGNSGSLPASGQPYLLRIYTVSGGNATLYATYGSQNNFKIVTDTDWLRWSGLSLPLAPNTTYAYTFARTNTGSGWDNLGNVPGIGYAGGEVCLIPANGGAVVYGSSHDYDGVFVIGLTLAGQPVVTPPSFAPVSPVYAGSPVTVSAAVTGTGPFNYQWQTDGGNTGVFTNIPGATGLTFVANTTGLDGFTVAYRLVAFNGAGSTAGEAALLTVNGMSGPIVPFPYSLPTEVVAVPGGTVALRVNEEGTLPLTNRWTLNGAALSDNSRISGAASNVLTIANVKASDAGHYQLNITNALGFYNVYPGGGADANLLVVSRPSFLTNGLGWVANGAATIADNLLTLTVNNNAGEVSSFFFGSTVYIGAFKTSFTYQDVGGGGADGMSFCLQNDPRGPAAIGGGGGALALSGISPSAALTFNIFGASGLSFGTNGANGSPYSSTAPVDVASGNPIAVNAVYANGVLQVKLTDIVTTATYETNLAVGDLTAVVGAPTAYVGFTGASGGVDSNQTITDFVYVPLTKLSVQSFGANLVLSWPELPGGYVLESTASLTTPNWQSVAAAVNQVGGLNQVTVPIGAGNAFYRLALP